MEHKSSYVKFWEELAQEVEGISGWERYLNKLKRTYWEAEFAGEEVACLKEGPPYRRALEMIAAQVEVLACAEKLKHAEERRNLKGKEFWLSIFEHMGLDEDAGLVFDPLHLRVLSKGCKDSPKQRSSDSHGQSLEGYKDLLKAALDNPLVASRMATDPFLNFSEIRHMADAIITGDFKPNLRRMIEGWIEDPIEAQESLPVLSEEDMPEWLVKLAKRLGQRRKWS